MQDRTYSPLPANNVCRWLVLLCCFLATSFGQDLLQDRSSTPASLPVSGTRAVEIYADSQFREGSRQRASGNVELHYDEIILTSNELEFDEISGDIEAQGSVHYRTTDRSQDLQATRMSYNIHSKLGTFYNARGRVYSASKGETGILTTTNPFLFEARLVNKTGDHYQIHNGRLTNCDPDRPWWTLRSRQTTIVPGDTAVIKKGVLRLLGVPLMYFPYLQKSLKRVPRQSGFLTPNVGNSSRLGVVLGQSYYWAINRSYDATLGATYYSSRGLATNLSFRGRPTETSTIDAVFFNVVDRGREQDDGSRLKQSGSSFDLSGQGLFGNGWRGVMDLHYLSSLEFRQAFTQTYEEAVFSQIRSIAFISRNFPNFSFNTSLLRNQHFQSVSRDDNIVIRKLPSIEFNGRERQIAKGKFPLWFGFDSSLDLVSRTQGSFQTRRFVQRGMFYPRVSSSISLKGFQITPTLGARAAAYGQRQVSEGLAGENLYRRTGEVMVDIVTPSLERIYNGPRWLGGKIKHVIEPRVRYRYIRGVEDFKSVIRFDERDLLHNTNEAEISLTNRLYRKHASSGRTHEVASLEIWQRRYFEPEFGGAIVPNTRNVLQSTLDFSSFAFLSEARNYSPIATSLNLNPNSRWNLGWRNDYDPRHGRLVNTVADASVQVSSKINITAGHRAVRAPHILTPSSNQFLTTLRYGDYRRRGWNLALNNVYDYNQGIFLYSISQVSYNTVCCGFSIELRRLSVGNARSDNQFRISIAIANVGSFGTLRPAERLF